MARILVLDTLKHPSNSGTANIVLSSDETTTMPTVNINGGQIDATTVGASTPSSVAATTISASGNATVGGTLGITGLATVGGTLGVTGASTLPTVDINGGAIDGTTIGSSSASTIAATTITASGNTTLSGSANTVGTVTAGTINEAVIMTGVPRKTLLIQIAPSAGNYQLVSGSSAQKCTHGSVSFSAISGKTYLIELNATVYMWSETDESIGIYCRLYRHTSAKSRGDTSGLGTQLQYKYAQCSVPGADTDLFNLTSAFGGFYMSGVFTASATQTEYVHLVVNNADLDTSSQVNFDGNQFLMKITEFDGDNYTTHTS